MTTPNDFDVLKNEPRTVEIGGEKLLIKPLVFKHYKGLVSEFPKILSEFAKENPDMEVEELIENPGKILGSFTDKVSGILLKYYALSVEKDEEFLENKLSLVELSELTVVFFEMNQLGRVIQNFRKLGAEIKNYLPQKENIKIENKK